MKVILVNGSPHEKGCTYTALDEVAKTLREEGAEAVHFWIGNQAVRGCIGCRRCDELHRCVFDDDKVNEFLKLAGGCDGFIFGSPVHWAAAGGAITSFMDRAFFAGQRREDMPFYLKPAAAVISARRAGTTATYDQMNKYFGLMQMPIISSQYWNMVPRPLSGRRTARCRRLADYAHLGPQYGLFPEMQGNGPAERRAHA